MSAETIGATADTDRLADRTTLTFDEFSVANRTRCEHPNGFNHPLQSWSTSDWVTAVVGELGEAANLVKKLNRYRDGIPGNTEEESALRTKLRRELGDVYVYLDLLAQSLGFSIADAAVEVFNAKSAAIGYVGTIAAGRPADLSSKALNEALAELDGRDGLSPARLRGAGKVLPYYGWFWRVVDFDRPITLARANGQGPDAPAWVGFCENNKWGYEEATASAEHSAAIRAAAERLVTAPCITAADALFDAVKAAWPIGEASRV